MLVVLLSGGVMMGMGALAVDASLARTGRIEVQAAADAASQAAIYYLDNTATGLTNAKNAAVLYANKYTAGGMPIAITASDVTTGVWSGGVFTVSSDAATVNAVKVSVRVGDIGGFFAGAAFGMNELAVGATSTAAATVSIAGTPTGAGEVDCFLPLAIPDCLLAKYPSQSIETVTLKLNPAGQDNAGWANPDGNVNANSSKGYIESLADGTCNGDGVTAAIGDPVALQNGVVVSAMSALANAIAGSDDAWDTATFGPLPARESNSAISASDYGHVIGGPILLFEDDSYCAGSGGSFNQTKPLSGFVTAYVYDVTTSGPASGKTIKMVIDRTNAIDVGLDDGGPNYGVVYTPTVTNEGGMVQ